MNSMEQARSLTEDYLQSVFSSYLPEDFAHLQGLKLLESSVRYSTFQSGKRFRPALCILICEQFGVHPQRVLPLAATIEMIHTYSLIHDDLPCMDDDDERRGLPTNHVKFGEAMALLAGDALHAEAFGHIAKSYAQDPAMAIRLIELLAEACGPLGMVGGQAIDIQQEKLTEISDLKKMHEMKTGALIRFCCEGASVVMGLPQDKQKLLRHFGESLGFAFQLADDLLDSQEENLEIGSYPALLGLTKTREILDGVTQDCFATLGKLGIEQGPIYELVKFNATRKS